MGASAVNVAITGAAGYVGRRVLARLRAERGGIGTILAIDRSPLPAGERFDGVEQVVADVRSPALGALLRERRIDSVVHLASIVTPRDGCTEDEQFSVDVLGTRNVLDACAAAGASHVVVTSSGAAYGYHPDNPEWIGEDAPLRGNDEFPYARHKRLVEEMLARSRADRPELRQLVLRPGTILGAGTSNQITALFEKPVILGIRGARTPFVFVWDEDVAEIIAIGVRERREGIFNLAGGGALELREIAALLGKPYIPLPAGLVAAALRALRPLGLTRYGPEQVGFLRWRPVLANDRLARDFGYTPRRTSREVFELWRCSRRSKDETLNERSFAPGAAGG